ncbi:MAG TPA: hypothetical protein VFI80_04580 [Burkholderiales bacterium]|nr:hypothetical protein [Burkholderiales bacterium]
MRGIVLAVLASASFSAVAGALDANLSSHTVEAAYYGNVGVADWTFGFLYNRDENNRAANVGVLATGDTGIGNSRIEGGLGGKLYGVHVAGSDVLSLALGGQVRWFPGNGPFAIGGYAFYAPNVVTFLDGQRFYDAGLRAEVEVFRNSFAYAGYRRMRADLDNGSQVFVDRGGFAGIRIIF